MIDVTLISCSGEQCAKREMGKESESPGSL